MYEHVEKSKENKGNVVANSVDQKNNTGKQVPWFVDNRPPAQQRGLQLAKRPDPEMLESDTETTRMNTPMPPATGDEKKVRQTQRKRNNDTVVQLVGVGEGFNVTDNSTQANPWIYVSMFELDAPVNVVVADDGAAPDDYIPFAQFCSVMSLEWLSNGSTLFSELEGDRQKAIVEIALGNPTNETQVQWGTEQLGGSPLDATDINDVATGKKILIYGPTHVTAAIRTKEGFRQYEPENGSETVYTVKEFTLLFGELDLVVS